MVSSTRNIADQVPQGVVATGTISQLDTTNRSVVFEGGQHFDDVDHIIFCTGYEYSQPFIRASRDTDEPLFPDGQTIDDLYDHILYAPNATLAFIGIIKGDAPTFLVVQAQAAFVARAFSQGAFITRLPPAARIRQMGYQEEDRGHVLQYPNFVDYCLRLEGICRRSGHNQELLFRWTPELEMIFLKTLYWAVDNLADIKFHIEEISLSPSLETLRSLIPYMILYCGNMDENSTLQILGRTLEPGVCLELHLQVIEELKLTLPALAASSRHVFETGVISILELWEKNFNQATNVQNKPPKPGQEYKRRTNAAKSGVNIEINQQPSPMDQLRMGFENVKVSFDDEWTGITHVQAQSQIRAILSNYMALLEGQGSRNRGRKGRAELVMSRWDTHVIIVPQ